jgi:hypothetical protein
MISFRAFESATAAPDGFDERRILWIKFDFIAQRRYAPVNAASGHKDIVAHTCFRISSRVRAQPDLFRNRVSKPNSFELAPFPRPAFSRYAAFVRRKNELNDAEPKDNSASMLPFCYGDVFIRSFS